MFEEIIEHIFMILSYYTPLICHLPNISQKLDLAIEINVEIKLNCTVHYLKDIIKKKVINFFFYHIHKKN